MSQVIHGKAYEYALAQEFGKVTPGTLVANSALTVAQSAYNDSIIGADTRKRMGTSAKNVAGFLCAQESVLASAQTITLQDDAAGKSGDPRDIVIKCPGREIGISAKHNSDTVKNSRLSDTIDFGKEWGGHPVSDDYWNDINPVFGQMRIAKSEGKMFRDIPNKAQVYYLPILTAFEDELRRLCEDHAAKFITPVFRYIIGRHDFYKAICRRKSTIIE